MRWCISVNVDSRQTNAHLHISCMHPTDQQPLIITGRRWFSGRPAAHRRRSALTMSNKSKCNNDRARKLRLGTTPAVDDKQRPRFQSWSDGDARCTYARIIPALRKWCFGGQLGYISDMADLRLIIAKRVTPGQSYSRRDLKNIFHKNMNKMLNMRYMDRVRSKLIFIFFLYSSRKRVYCALFELNFYDLFWLDVDVRQICADYFSLFNRYRKWKTIMCWIIWKMHPLPLRFFTYQL